MAIYPDVLQKIRNACGSIRNNEMSVVSFQSLLAWSADAIVAIEEKELRQFLDIAENRIELIRFTVDSDKIRDEVLKPVDNIETELWRKSISSNSMKIKKI